MYKPTIFRGEFDRIQRVVKVVMDWYIKPDVWELDSTQDMTNWETGFNS